MGTGSQALLWQSCEAVMLFRQQEHLSGLMKTEHSGFNKDKIKFHVTQPQKEHTGLEQKSHDGNYLLRSTWICRSSKQYYVTW